MPLEIERKFLVAGDAWRTVAHNARAIRQGYVARGQYAVVRVRLMAPEAFITIKFGGAGMVRHEFEYPIPVEDARELLHNACVRPLIEKTRYDVPWNGRDWVIDEFTQPNPGLLLAEIELAAADEQIELPEWAGREVTDDPAFRNDRMGVSGA